MSSGEGSTAAASLGGRSARRLPGGSEERQRVCVSSLAVLPFSTSSGPQQAGVPVSASGRLHLP